MEERGDLIVEGVEKWRFAIYSTPRHARMRVIPEAAHGAKLFKWQQMKPSNSQLVNCLFFNSWYLNSTIDNFPRTIEFICGR
jgi:hypothetical protein